MLLDRDHERYHTLNETGTRIWNLLETGATMDQLVDAVCEEFDCEAEGVGERVADDVRQLVTNLARAGLLSQ